MQLFGNFCSVRVCFGDLRVYKFRCVLEKVGVCATSLRVFPQHTETAAFYPKVLSVLAGGKRAIFRPVKTKGFEDVQIGSIQEVRVEQWAFYRGGETGHSGCMQRTNIKSDG